MKTEVQAPLSLRWFCVQWLYAAAIVHSLVGVVLAWAPTWLLSEHYHQPIDLAFWQSAAPSAARAQQLWWIGLFGVTVQSLGLWMWALVYLGQRHRSRFAWGALIVGIVIWAPQDLFISLQADAWLHVWVDLIAVVSMLPPLLWLYWYDGRQTSSAPEQPS